MTTNHERFLHHLDASEKGVSFVSDWLSDFGVDVSHGQITKAKEAKDWKKHVDSGDLFIKQRVEVKKLSYCFSTTHWPHGKKFLENFQTGDTRAIQLNRVTTLRWIALSFFQ